MTDGKRLEGLPFPPHTAINNEYGWLWLHRDGTPTFISQPVYDACLGRHATPDECLELNGYLLAELTEFWRVYRNYAGVMYYGCLDGDRPVTGVTCDNFRDVATLEFHQPFEDYVSEAFKPLGLYINFWQPTLVAGSKRTYRVMMVNDTYEPARGDLELVWQVGGGRSSATARRHYEVPALGQMAYDMPLTAPTSPGSTG